MATMQKLAIVVKKIIELKKQGIAQSDIAVVLTNMNIKPPSGYFGSTEPLFREN